ncbi:MAG: hypothetical protein V2A73_03320, partial [Pseudomonadota bacterium]
LGAAANVVAVDRVEGGSRGEILVAAGRIARAFDLSGREKTSFDVGTGMMALARIDDWLVVGFKEGNIQLVPVAADAARPTFAFEAVPPSPVTRIVAGPTGTLIAGFGNGLLGIWSLANGAQIDSHKMHGPVEHLLRDNAKLYAATSLGDWLVLDLAVFEAEYCDLLRSVWRRVPVVWEGGLPAPRPPPRGHRCRL